ncbi:D-glycero-alpha-D-manno-heptose-1,7-bisphosphate 7-phosphatase [Conexibacter woesei]|uniref:D,D-heptose 1,7-bisphosphate phosphatase n=1 Tax=Conexibacter woesei (strain DSM 14684 / CCUG 47730 / CIP 108061 / JCM 11494 / NBRC 100937 / ID131577) TaxID=469383 RepID=D3EZN8_CONWI|nr:HAD family hydrolase [Conexibacter woesei]ADB53876.1 histidinol-phosphate phosphatase family protein [Conexibacter woesei DSM 14684]
MSKAVFLDRDGTLNAAVIRDERPYPPATPGELELIDGVADACAELTGAGFKLVCITNQPDIARGTQERATVDAINARLLELLALDEIVVCPHDDADDCPCRKPRPGMILDSAERLGIDLARSVTVGDRWRDVDAGHGAGTRTVFIDRGYAEQQPAAQPDLTVSDLKESIPWILASTL